MKPVLSLPLQLQFEKGDLITVTKVVDGGWWEGICGDKVGWFPGLYVEEIPTGTYIFLTVA